jgi:hypothetical protein
MQLIAGEMTAKGKILRLFEALAIPKPSLARSGAAFARNEIGGLPSQPS